MRIRQAVMVPLATVLLGGIAFVGVAQASFHSPAAPANGTTYVAVVPCCQTIVLGTQGNPTRVLTSKVIPPGKYSVVAQVGIVMGPAPSGGQEGTVCSTGTDSGSDTATTPFGSTGNGATESGQGPNGTYGNNVMNGTVIVRSTASHLVITCNSTQGNRGTYASSAEIVATRIPKVVNISG